ncbi:MAG: error-prone DNA polymerase [Planctomycetota bacterium]
MGHNRSSSFSYAELHCKTNFSFLEGASHPQELVDRAVELGYGALAITDRNTLAGVVRAHAAAKAHGLHLIIGAEITPIDFPPLVLWVTDREAYGRLSRLITLGRRRAAKGECELTFADVAQHAEGLLAGLVTEFASSPDSKPAPKRDELPILDVRAASEPAKGVPLMGSKAHRTASRHGLSEARSNGLEPCRSMVDHSCRDTFQPPVGIISLTDEVLGQFRATFGDRGYLLAAFHRGCNDERVLGYLMERSGRGGIPLLASGNVLYHHPARMPLHDVLTGIRHGRAVSDACDLLQPNAQRHLQSLEEIDRAFSGVPEALRRTREVARQCAFSLDELRYEYPEELTPCGQSPIEYLRHLSWKGARRRYPDGIPDKVRRLIIHELALIQELHYEAYFLTVWDLVRFARRRDILCQGRGSAANSAVCFCLGITSVDPRHMDVLFERFVSRERNEAPDIDVDFEHERREEVLQYLYDKYGRERAGMTAVVITYRMRSAIRDVGKALGLSLDRVDALAKQLDGYATDSRLAQRCAEAGIDPRSETGRRLVHLVEELLGFPRHLSQHVGGMVITQGPLCELVPIENAAMDGRTVIQWDKDDLDTLGLLKVDCLALGMLSAIHRCFDMARRYYGQQLTLANIPLEDAAVYDMICRADTIGVFQIESRAQMSMLPRLKPRCYYDLVIEVAIVRPGPIQGNMVHPYLRRRTGEEPVTYPNAEIQEVLEKTLGIPLFQEQAMQMAVVAAGFTPGEADQLRRAMGAWRSPGTIDRFRNKLIAGMRQKGLSEEFAQQVFQRIRGFGEYGFPESHAASFALLVYVSAWLKYYYPGVFGAALINSQPMGFYSPSQLVRDARGHGVTVLPVDANSSFWECTLERLADMESQHGSHDASCRRSPTSKSTTSARTHYTTKQTEGQRGPRANTATAGSRMALRLGFCIIKGIPRSAVTRIEQTREQGGQFRSLADFTRRTSMERSLVMRLAEADVFQSLKRDRRSALWEALDQDRHIEQLPLFQSLAADGDPSADLPRLTEQEEVFSDYMTAGLSLRAHPLSFHRPSLDKINVVTLGRLKRLQHKRQVRIAGLVQLRQRPSTAKGITFVTLEDETGTANLLIHPTTWQQYYQVARHCAAWLVHGRMERKYDVIHVVVRKLEDLSVYLANTT